MSKHNPSVISRVAAHTGYYADNMDFWIMKVREYARRSGLTPTQTEQLSNKHNPHK